MEQVPGATYTQIVNSLGSNPALLLLGLVLLGLGLLAYKLIPLFFRPFVEMSEATKSMAKDLSELSKDMAVIAERVSSHESRIKKLEERE